MLNNLSKLISILDNCAYTLASETMDHIKIKLCRNDYSSIDEFYNILVSIIRLNPEKITINSFIQPSLNSKKQDYSFPEYIKEHIQHAERLSTPNITYDIFIKKDALLENTSDTNYNWFLKLDSYIKIIQSPIDNIEIISKIHSIDKKNILIFLDNKYFYLKNNSTLIIGINNIPKINTFNSVDSNLQSKIDLRKTCCNIDFNLSKLVPDLFIFDYSISLYSIDDTLKILFNNIFSLLFIVSLSNNSSLDENTIISKISSNKSIIIKYNLNDITIERLNYASLIQLYYLSYNSLSIQNIYLVRNIICIYLCDDCSHTMLDLFFIKANQVLDSSSENLNILTIGNVENYFTIRYTLYDFLDKSTDYINSQILELISKMNKTFLSTIATLVGVSYVYLKNDSITILKLSILIYTLFLIIDFLYSFTLQFSSYRTYIKRHEDKLDYFKPIIGNEQYEKLTKKDKYTSKLKIRFHFYFWPSFIIYCFMILGGLYSFFNISKIIELIKMFI